MSKNKNITIQKSDKGNSVVIIDKADLDKIEKLLNDTRKFEQLNLKNDEISNFAINQEKRVDNILIKLAASNSTSEETHKSLKSVGVRPGIMYRLCKVHKDIIDNCPPFRPILSAISTSTYKLAKLLAPILKSLTIYEYTVKDSFTFAEEIIEQDSEFFMEAKQNSKTECPFAMYKLFVKIKHLPLLSTVNLPLVEFIHILTVFYHLPIGLVLFTHSLIDALEFALVGLNYTMN